MNEAKTIGILLQHLIENSSSKNIYEIIVVDGGSSDSSKKIVNEFVTSSDSIYGRKVPVANGGENKIESYRKADETKGLSTFLQRKNTRPYIRLIESNRGRAIQMNAGAKQASGDILYFLHADSLPPRHFDESILNEVSKGNNIGCFRMKFDKDYPILKFSQWFTRFNFKFCRGGDQSLYITSDIFKELNGYNENYGVYEDCEFIGRVYQNYKFTIINDYVVTSSRKYDRNGSWRLQYHFTMIHLKKWTGASADELNRYYRRHIV